MHTRIKHIVNAVALALTIVGAGALASSKLLDGEERSLPRRWSGFRPAHLAIALASLWTAVVTVMPFIRTAVGTGPARGAFSHSRRSIVGQRLPLISARTLSGHEVRLPDDLSGKVVLLAMGFGYSSRANVEAWVNAFRDRFHGHSGLVAYRMAMLGSIARLAASIVETGMRSATNIELHSSVLTTYEPLEPLRQALGAAEDSDTWVYLIGPGGTVLFQCSGGWDEMLFRQLAATAEAAIVPESQALL